MSGCDNGLLTLSADIESFIEDGLSIIALKDLVDYVTQEEFDYIPSTVESIIQLNMINPYSLGATYTLATNNGEFLENWELDDSDALSNKLYITLDPGLTAEHNNLDFTLDIYASSINRTYDSIDISLSCDTPPNNLVDLTVDVDDDAVVVAAFTLPFDDTDDDLEYIEITYYIVGDSENQTTVKIGADDDAYKTPEGTISFSVDESDYLRYYTPPGALAGDSYYFSIVLIDEAAQESSAVTGTNSADYAKLSYSENGGTWINNSSTYYVELGVDFELPTSDDIYFTDYILSGWTADDVTYYDPGSSVSIEEDTEFTAAWERENLTITCYSNTDNDYSDEDVAYSVDSCSTNELFTVTVLEDDYYTFAGWDTDSTADTTVYYDVDSGFGDDALSITMETSEITLYAVWVEGTPIRTAEELDYMSASFSGDYYLTRDIDLSSYTDSGSDPVSLSPMGTSSDSSFISNFYGWGHTLSNLTIDYNSSYCGLFGYVDSIATISNLKINGATFSNSAGNSYVGIIAGRVEGTIENCTVDAGATTLEGSNQVGGIAGMLSDNGIISNCTFTGSIQGSGSYVGGIVGYSGNDSGTSSTADCSITDCSVTLSESDILQAADYGGGIVGYASNTSISNCAVDGDGQISDAGDGYIGGLAGYTENSTISSSTISDLFISTSGNYTGGLVGYAYGSVLSGCTFEGSSDAYASVTSSDDKTGGLIGYAQSCETIDCSVSYVNISSDGDYTGGLIGCLSGTDVDSCSIGGESTVNSEGSYAGGVAGQASSSSTFTDCIVGESDNLVTVTSSSSYAGGLIGDLVGGSISGCTVYASVTTDEKAGGMAGSSSGSATITSSEVYGSSIVTSSSTYTGGLIGSDNGSTITYCAVGSTAAPVTVTPYGNYGGGLIGYASRSTVNYNSVKNLTMTSTEDAAYLGGLIGYAKECTEINYNSVTDLTMSLSSSTYSSLGGLIGYLKATSSNNTTIDQSYVEGTINYNSAGLIGEIDSNSYSGNSVYFSISNCYTRVNISSGWGLIGSTDSYDSSLNFAEYCYSIAIDEDVTYLGLLEYNDVNTFADPTTECYYLSEDDEGSSVAIADSYGSVISSSSFLVSGNFSTWDIYDDTDNTDGIWAWDDSPTEPINDGYPYLRNLESTYSE
jgi:hypothetical protein